MREDIINALSLVTGSSKAGQLVTNTENYVKAQAKNRVEQAYQEIRAQAMTGATAAIPQIQAQVRATVKPYVYMALGLGALGALLGGIALVKSRRR